MKTIQSSHRSRPAIIGLATATGLGVLLLAILLALLGPPGAPAYAGPDGGPGRDSFFEVIHVFPPNASHTATLTEVVSATFNQPVDPASVNASSFPLYGGQSQGLFLSASYGLSGDGLTVNLAHDQLFRPGELLQATVTTDTLSTGGQRLARSYVWQFRTAVVTGSAFFTRGQTLDDRPGSAVALADLNGDDFLDAFIANSGYPGAPNTVWFGDGAGGFSDSGQLLGNSSSEDVALGDVDGDGDFDAFVANGVNQPNTVWLNDGAGFFSDSGQRLGTATSLGVALGDVDGDGDLDAFVANFSSAYPVDRANTVWLNDGAGGFSDSGQRLGSSASCDVALGDLDGDYDLDAFVANCGGGQPNTVWWNDGAGHFSDSGQRLGNAASRAVALGDLEDDGDLDVFVANYADDFPVDPANRVWLNNGAGYFQDSGQALGAAESYGVAVGDVNGDGALDAFVANKGPNRVWLNDGSSVGGLGLAYSRGVDLGDLDGDGDLDAVVANFTLDQVWLNVEPPCPIEATLDDPAKSGHLARLRRFRDEMLLAHEATQPYVARYYRHAPELTWLLLSDAELRERTAQVLQRFSPAVQALLDGGPGQDAVLTGRDLAPAEALLADMAGRASPALQDTLAEVRALLAQCRGRTVKEAWRMLVTE